jgi:hypothetical protein
MLHLTGQLRRRVMLDLDPKALGVSSGQLINHCRKGFHVVQHGAEFGGLRFLWQKAEDNSLVRCRLHLDQHPLPQGLTAQSGRLT